MRTLEEVVAAFESWRLSKEHKNVPIPDRLWTMANALLPYYKKTHIKKVLRVSGSQFNERCVTSEKQNTEATPVDGFVVGAFWPKSPLRDEVCEMTLKGLHKSLQIKISVQHVAHILSVVERYL